MQAVFWIAVALLLAPYTLYPALLLVLGRLRPVRLRGRGEPTATVIVPAHNEERVIAARLENFLSVDYPPEKLDLILALDGCDDGTEAIARRYEGERVRILSLPRGGKMQALNEAAALARGEVLVFSDAEWTWRKGAVRELLAPFGDERVGCVCGAIRYLRGALAGGGSGEGAYTRLETWLKRLESRVGSVLVAYGPNYALRRELFRPLRPNLSDDFVLPNLAAAAGRLVVFAEGSVAVARPTRSAGELFRQKRRIIAQGIEGMVRFFGEIVSAGPLRLAQAFLHKGLRWLGPVFLAALYVASWALAEKPFYLAAAIAQTGFYALGAVGLLRWGRGPRLLRLPAYFCLVNAAAAAALWVAVTGGQAPTWEKAETAR